MAVCCMRTAVLASIICSSLVGLAVWYDIGQVQAAKNQYFLGKQLSSKLHLDIIHTQLELTMRPLVLRN